MAAASIAERRRNRGAMGIKRKYRNEKRSESMASISEEESQYGVK